MKTDKHLANELADYLELAFDHTKGLRGAVVQLRRIESLETDSASAYANAKSLAEALFKKHFAHEEPYASGSVVWEVCDSTAGVISQIDNMVCSLVRPAEKPTADDYNRRLRQQLESEWEGLAEIRRAEQPAHHTEQPLEMVDAYCKAWKQSFTADNPYHTVKMTADDRKHIEAGLKAALAEQPAQQQEPVAYWIPKAEQFCIANPSGRPFAKAWEPLYTSPQPPAQRTWVGLSDDEKRQLFDREDYQGWLDYINAIEAKLREKNGITKKGGAA